jgi:hypothetical protein
VRLTATIRPVFSDQNPIIRGLAPIPNTTTPLFAVAPRIG